MSAYDKNFPFFIYRKMTMYPKMLKEIAEKHDIPQDHIINLMETLDDKKAEETHKDMLHIGDEGQSLIADRLFEELFLKPEKLLQKAENGEYQI